jgi:hypothetical protein
MVAAILHLARKDFTQHHQASRFGAFCAHYAVSKVVTKIA